MTPTALADWWAWQAMWCRAWGLDDAARECTRVADAWRAIAERMER